MTKETEKTLKVGIIQQHNSVEKADNMSRLAEGIRQ